LWPAPFVAQQQANATFSGEPWFFLGLWYSPEYMLTPLLAAATAYGLSAMTSARTARESNRLQVSWDSVSPPEYCVQGSDSHCGSCRLDFNSSWYFDRRGMCASSVYPWRNARLTRCFGQKQQTTISSTFQSLPPALNGSTLLMIGDSVCRDQFVDLACSLDYSKSTQVNVHIKDVDPRVQPKEFLQSPLLISVHAKNMVFWVALVTLRNLATGTQKLRGDIRRIAQLVKVQAKTKKVDVGPTVVHMCSIKAHSLNTHGYGRNTSAYFGDLLRLAMDLKADVDWKLFFYRPGPATHFATADAGYLPNRDAAPKPCRSIDPMNVSTQKNWFIQEERMLTTRQPGIKVLSSVFDISLAAWDMHPGVRQYVINNTDVYKTDCLHFCVVGNGYVGVYAAFNQLWWHEMRTAAAELPT